MQKQDSQEAAPIVDAVLEELLGQVPSQGITGANLRMAANSVRVNALFLLGIDSIGAPLQNIFQLAQATGATLAQMEQVRAVASAFSPITVGAILVRDSLVQYALATEGAILATVVFTSRDDVEALRPVINAEFASAEELAADAMDSVTYQSIVSLHAAMSYFLTQTAQPLPRMLSFAFAAPLPTLVAAYKLYADASRADELRDQNKVIHPAFMLPTGRALSA
jgi:prophage DNA circulation protein